MKEKPTLKDYTLYMATLKKAIKESETRIKILEVQKEVSKLSFEDWIKFMNGKLKSQIEIECKKSLDGKHHYVLPPDSFDSPYCRYCYKT